MRWCAPALALMLAGCAVHTAGTAGGASSASPARRASAVPSSRAPVTSPQPAATVVRERAAPVPAHVRAIGTSLAGPLPYILHLSLSPTVVAPGTTVSASVRTTPGVISVVAYAGGGSMTIPRVGIGLFSASTSLPPLPSFVHGVYPVTFVARDGRGRTTQAAINVTVP